MPTQLKRPRLRKPRLALSVLERYKVLREAGSLSTYMPVLLALSHAPAASVGQRARSRALVLLLLSMLAGAQLLMSLPRQHQASTIYPRCPDDFGDDEFRDHFRFRKPDFYRLLIGFELANMHGPQLARYMHVGARVVRTDWALMVLLKRMASTATYKDLRFVVGGSKTAVCSTFLHMLEYLYNNFTDRVTSLLVWEDHMLGFATLMQAKGSPYDGLVGLLDGHFLDISRPGGAGCRGNNVFDWQVFNGKERSHGLKWQGIVLANGMAVLQVHLILPPVSYICVPVLCFARVLICNVHRGPGSESSTTQTVTQCQAWRKRCPQCRRACIYRYCVCTLIAPMPKLCTSCARSTTPRRPKHLGI